MNGVLTNMLNYSTKSYVNIYGISQRVKNGITSFPYTADGRQSGEEQSGPRVEDLIHV